MTEPSTADTHQPSGFTLVEMLVSLTASMLLVGGLYSVLFESQATHEAQEDRSQLRQQARVVVDQMADELRMAGYDLGSATERIAYAGRDQISIIADIDNGAATLPCGNAVETAVGGGAERVNYRLVATSLLRTVDCWDGGAWANEYTDAVVAINVMNTRPIFRYFDEDGVQLNPGTGTLNAATRNDVRVIEIQLDVMDPDQQVLGQANVDFQLRTSVRVRNAEY